MNIYTEDFSNQLFDFANFLSTAVAVEGPVAHSLEERYHVPVDVYEITNGQACVFNILSGITIRKEFYLEDGAVLSVQKKLYPFEVYDFGGHLFAIVDDDFEKDFDDFWGKLESYRVVRNKELAV